MTRPRVVIIGGGFAGIEAARALRTVPVDVTLIDRTNHHLFQPLLYQVATAALAPTEITVPLRWLLRKQRNATVLLGDAEAVDPGARRIRVRTLAGTTDVAYDYLIVAAGARHAYFGHPDWERVAPGLKTMGDALEMRRRFLTAFERAEEATDPAEQAAWLTIVVVGGGPTGVELAGVIPEIARRAMRPDFRRIDTDRTRVILLEGGPRVLPAFPEGLSERARTDLTALGVEVRTGALVTGVDATGVHVGATFLPARTVLWAAGNAASPLGKTLGAAVDRAGRVPVQPDLSVPGHEEIFVCGDLAVVTQDGRLVPGVAPAAMQEGRAAAWNVARAVRGEARRPFHYHDKGNLATIGRSRAVADFGFLRIGGRLAWLLWLFVHILYLAGFRNRLSVLLQWGYAWLTYQRGARLIVDGAQALSAREPAASR
jgi:NADH:quinone reductase (non-electrogenic)